MTQKFRTVISIALGLLVTVSFNAQAQQPPRFLTLSPPEGFPIVPLLEGWVRNDDGSRTIIFGYINRNEDEVDVPVGENNYIEPAEFNGMQPGHFASGRGAQVFSVILPPDRADEDVWWYIRSGDKNELLKVPGRANASAYELDFIRPRPQGALRPLVGVGVDGAQAAENMAVIADYPRIVRVGERIEMAINAMDPSVRDPSDPRFKEPLDLGVHWAKHQGPGNVTFSYHPETPQPENPYNERDPRYARWEADPREASIEGGNGVAKVWATFSTPGEYLIRTMVENWQAPDSSQGDQCCWTNVYQRVTVR
ncbi:MAG: hypothetical protein R3F41_03120 [Gammaproteobacteria bacterium]|nr:hypothetical protein [Pseudomonadales bacterium]MCP5345715.1 hypothetical protein [Pseudomonadales bacterium]